MHYYKRNLGDYAKKAGRLSMLQHGSYTLLIDACYDREQFPTLDEAIEWTWASTNDEIEAVKFVLSKFFKLENDVYVQKRIQEEIAEYHDKAVKNQRIAQEREEKKREALTKRAENSTNRAQEVHESAPNHKPLTNNQEPLLKAESKPFVAPKARPTKKPPSDFSITTDMSAWATVNGICNLQAETEAFKDHEFATAKTDWVATWRNWMRRANRDKPKPFAKPPALGVADRIWQNHLDNQQKRIAP